MRRPARSIAEGAVSVPAPPERLFGDFLAVQKVTKEPLGGGRNRRFGKASRLHDARPLEPLLRGTRTC